MKTSRLFLLPAIALAAIVLPARAEYSSFVRPTLLYVDPIEDGASSEFGGLVQIGGGFDAAELAFETGYVSFSQKATIDTTSGPVNLRGDLRLTPVLATARWRAPFGAGGKFAGLFGVSGGVSQTRLSGSASGAIVGSVKDTQWLGTWGAELGVQYRASARTEVFAGYRYLAVAGSDWFGLKVDSIDANVFYAGIGWRF